LRLTKRHQELLKHTFIDFKQTAEFLKDPVIFTRGEGLYLWDIEGRKYYDAIGGIYAATLGHCHPRVIEALKKQMERLTLAPPLHSISDTALDFVEKLGSVTPGNLNFIKQYSGGSESIEAAMKFTRQYFKQSGYPGKYKFISHDLSYHGATFAAMAASGSGKRKNAFEPHMPGFFKVPSPIQYRDRFSSWEDTCQFCASMFEDMIISEGPDTVAGIILEPICNTGGIIVPTEEYFKSIREICNSYNVLLIFDEVLTGFAKTGNMFAAQTFKVTPDIICAGKGLSSGAVPIGSMAAREDLAGIFYGCEKKDIQFFHGHTFAGNPLSCAAGIAVIDEIIEKDLAGKAKKLGKYLKEKLCGLKRLGTVREIRGKGVLIGVELVKDTGSMAPFPELGEALKKTSLKNGLIMSVDPGCFAVCPPLIAEEPDIDILYDLIESSLKDAIEIAI